jgi:hypothetical protein
MSRNRVSWAALAVSIAALVAAISGAATGLTGRNSVDRNDIKAGAVQFSDLSKAAKKRLRAPAASAVITGYGSGIEVTNARGMSAANVLTNNAAWCIHDLGFTPRIAQVRTITGPPVESRVESTTNSPCYEEAVIVNSTASYSEKYYIAIYR